MPNIYIDKNIEDNIKLNLKACFNITGHEGSENNENKIKKSRKDVKK